MRKVTPRAGVWIETRCRALPRRLRTRSLPVRECGLKQGVGPEASVDRVSLPVRECGLKPARQARPAQTAIVTPRAGVWIETEARRDRSLIGSRLTRRF